MTDQPETGTPEVPRPNVSAEVATQIAADRYGMSGDIKELGSQQDRNFRFATSSGRYLLKVANPAFTREEFDAQNLGLDLVLAAGISAPATVPSLSGKLLETVDPESFDLDQTLITRLSTFVEGEPLTATGYLAPSVVAGLGNLAARTDLALADFDHPGLHRSLQWDLQRANLVVDELATYIADEGQRLRVARATALAWAAVGDVADQLRKQPIHGDLTDDNVVCEVGDDLRLHPFGVIDFGDLSVSWLVGEIAVTCSSILHHNPEDPLAVLPAIEAFNELIPLTDAEITALWPLVVLRGAVLAASGEFQVAVDPDNEYARTNLPHEWEVFEVATSLPSAVAEVAIRQHLGRERSPVKWAAPAAVPVLGELDSRSIAIVDYSVTSALLHKGRWLDVGIERRLLANALGAADAAIARYGEFRLTRTPANSSHEPATCALGVEIAVGGGGKVRAPAPGRIRSVGDGSVVLETADFDVHISGIKVDAREGSDVKIGEKLGSLHKGLPMRVQLCTVRGLVPPPFARPAHADAWLAVCPDPSPLFGVDCAAEQTSAAITLARRDASYAEVQRHYYTNPPQIERGWRHHLVDTRGRSYVDMVNNVSGIGHGHPKLALAIEQQILTLNTNSRFNYKAVADFAERIASLAPLPLDTVLLVNSGTEAVDLALRLAQAYTGRNTFAAFDEAYHGWSIGADAVSASTADNPIALETRPDWVRFFAAPNSYRGYHRGHDSGSAWATDAADRLHGWTNEGTQLAAFICEPVFGNGGGILLPDGYLKQMYALVRSHGGLVISDEVQVGYGRLGHHFWGCQQQGVTPDIITIAKSMGNGHPLGAVITTKAIAAALTAQGALFSSPGGSPVSCVAGMTVLDVMTVEALQHNAASVGDYLRDRLRDLATRRPIIGAVHGLGLYLGIELVRDRDTLEPAAKEAQAICDRLLHRGVIVQPTGDRFNVLKVKPPLCINRASVDFFVDQLDEVLSRGW